MPCCLPYYPCKYICRPVNLSSRVDRSRSSQGLAVHIILDAKLFDLLGLCHNMLNPTGSSSNIIRLPPRVELWVDRLTETEHHYPCDLSTNNTLFSSSHVPSS